MKWNKKGMEIAVSTVVGMILGGLMLVAGFALLANLLINVNKVEVQITDRMEEELLSAFDTNEPIFIHRNNLQPQRRTDAVIFGVGVHNIFNTSREFKLVVDDQNISHFLGGEGVLTSPVDSINVASRQKVATFVIVPTNNLTRGQHHVVLEVRYDDGAGFQTYDRKRILYIDNT